MRWFVGGFWLAIGLGCAANVGPETDELEEGPTVELEVLREPQLFDHSRLPERDDHFEDVIVSEDSLIFIYDTPPLEPLLVGDVVTGVVDDGYIRRIVAIDRVTPTRHVAQTVPAELAEFLRDVHFIATFRPEGDSWEPQPADGDTGRRTDAVRRRTNLVNGVQPRCDFSADAGASLRVWAEANMHFSLEVDINWWWDWGQADHIFDARAGGSITGGISLTAQAGADLSCTWDIADDVRALRPRTFTSKFAIGIVPITLHHTITPIVRLTLDGSIQIGPIGAEASFTLGADAHAHYDEDGWDNTFTPIKEVNGSITIPDAGGEASATLKLNVGLSYEVLVWDSAGPNIEMTPYVEARLGATGCEWSRNLAIGLEGKIGGRLRVPVINKELATWSEDLDIARAALVDESGTFEHCDPEAGSGSGGTTGGGPGGGPGGTGGEDSCAARDSCGGCNAETGCGWCGDTNTCVPNSERGSCGDWRDSPSACEPCEATSCGECATSGFCVWCPSLGCVNQSTDQFDMCGEDFAANPHDCR